MALVAAGDRRAADEMRTWLTDRTDSAARSVLLDPLAVAASQSEAALELLLWAIDELRLADPSLRRLLVADPDLDEARQDVLVAVAEIIGGFRGEARFTTWLHQVARYKAIALLRRRRPDQGDGAVPLDDDPGPGDAARLSSIIATRVSVTDVVAGLPDLYREAVVLRDVDQRTYDEIAATLDLNVNTAKARVARGRALVAARLGER